MNGGYNAARGKEAVLTGYADAVAYRRAFLANPDLPRRLQLGVPLNEPDQQTFYGGGAREYTDYPSLSQDSTAHYLCPFCYIGESKRGCSMAFIWSIPEIRPEIPRGGISKKVNVLFIPSSGIPQSRFRSSETCMHSRVRYGLPSDGRSIAWLSAAVDLRRGELCQVTRASPLRHSQSRLCPLVRRFEFVLLVHCSFRNPSEESLEAFGHRWVGECGISEDRVGLLC